MNRLFSFGVAAVVAFCTAGCGTAASIQMCKVSDTAQVSIKVTRGSTEELSLVRVSTSGSSDKTFENWDGNRLSATADQVPVLGFVTVDSIGPSGETVASTTYQWEDISYC